MSVNMTCRYHNVPIVSLEGCPMCGIKSAYNEHAANYMVENQIARQEWKEEQWPRIQQEIEEMKERQYRQEAYAAEQARQQAVIERVNNWDYAPPNPENMDEFLAWHQNAYLDPNQRM